MTSILKEPAAYLGVDIGSAAGKICNFCLIETGRLPGCPTVTFERGCRPGEWPPNEPGHFEDLAQPTWLSAAAEAGIHEVLENSTLVTRWRQQPYAAVVDAPSGFAIAGSSCRDTEAAAQVGIYCTSSLELFNQSLVTFAGAGNATPLRQRYYWKLVGFEVFRWLAAGLGQHVPPPAGDLAHLCYQPIQPGRPRLREGFPSLTYARARLGCLTPLALNLLADLVQADWVPAAHGNPRPGVLQDLVSHRREPIRQELAAPQEGIPSMRKAGRDPRWGDLWDAFTLAFVGCCEDLGAARFVVGCRGREQQEGAILSAGW